MRWPLSVGLFLQQSREGHRSRSFRQGLLPLEQDHDGVGDFLFIDGDDLVDKAFHQGQGEISRAANGNPVRNGCFGGKRDGTAMLHGAQHGGEALRLYAHHTNGGIALLQCAGDATDQSPAADGHDDCLQSLHLLQQLEADRPLTIDHRSVIERMQKRQPFQLADSERLITSLVVVRAVQDHFGSESTRGGDLHQGRHQGHDNARQNPALGGVIGHGLGMISGAGGDHAAALLIVTQQQNAVERTAFFEGSGPLQIIQLEVDLLTGNLGERG